MHTDKSEDPSKWYIEIYNLPEHLNKEDIGYFLWKTLDKCRALKKATNPITRLDYVEDARCIRVFFRSKDQTLNCLDLNGILYGTKAFYMKSPLKARDHPMVNPRDLQIKRYKNKVDDGFNKLIIQNMPYMQEFQVLNMLKEFGDIKAFEPAYNDKLMTYCFFQYDRTQAAEDCLAKLNNQKVRGKMLSVKRAVMAKEITNKSSTTKVKTKASVFEKDPYSFYLTFDTVGYFKKMKISCVLLLRNIVSTLVDRQFVKEDIKKEVEKIGRITRFVCKDKNIYIEYEKVEYAQIAYLLLLNRKYEGKNIDVNFYDPLNFADDILI